MFILYCTHKADIVYFEKQVCKIERKKKKKKYIYIDIERERERERERVFMLEYK